MSPAPKYNHQKLVSLFAKKIFYHLDKIKCGELILSPFDVFLEHLNSAVQPDLIYLSNANRGILKDDGCIHGAPDMVIEILSSDKKRDSTKKRDLYEKAGVKEYIMVDSVTKKFTRLELIGGYYENTFEGEGVFSSALLGLEFEF